MFHLLHWQFNGHENTLPSPALPRSRNYDRCQTWCHRRDLPRFNLSPLIKIKIKQSVSLHVQLLSGWEHFATDAQLSHQTLTCPYATLPVPHRESGTVWKVQIESSILTDIASLPIHIYTHCISPPHVLIQTVNSGQERVRYSHAYVAACGRNASA